MMEWQPIETVPQGVKVLQYLPAIPMDKYGHNDQVATLNIGYGAKWGDRMATHWMKLPEPPKETA